ncbi:hypothetical protein D3C76_1803830 [compost metagenome]
MLVSLAPALGGGDFAVQPTRAFAVAADVERGEYSLGEFPGLIENGVRKIGAESVAAGKAAYLVQMA